MNYTGDDLFDLEKSRELCADLTMGQKQITVPESSMKSRCTD